MAHRHFYFVFENLALSNDDWVDLVLRFKQRGSTDDPQPARCNHWRYRLDDQAIIFEALFNEQAVNELAVEGILTSVTGIPPIRIDYETIDNITMYEIDGVDTLVQQVFGSDEATWDESRLDCHSYLFVNMSKWESEEEE